MGNPVRDAKSLTGTTSTHIVLRGNTLRNHPKSPTAVLTQPTEPTPVTSLTLTEVLSVMQYLLGRGLLCQKCGVGWGKYLTQYHIHCEDCRFPTMNYSEQKKGSDFEQLLCKRVQDFSKAYFK